ncbi:MAG TPA: hypothetical protein VFJ61_03175 [Solirubrobacterales bacterium]|nr:hypothetical protein [Solirubrobacterales bacterium]
MSAHEIDTKLRGADRFSAREMDALELGPAEAALLEEIVAEPATVEVPEAAPALWPPRRRHRGSILGLAGLTAAAAALLVVLLLGGGSGSPSRSDDSATSLYGAALVRFAQSSPLLLLEGPGWRVQNVTQYNGREGTEGTMEFVTGKPVPYETIRVTGNSKSGERAFGMFPPAVRQRRVELAWRHDSLEQAIATARGSLHPHGQRWIELPVLETTAQVDTRAEFYVNQGGPGNRQMTAFWSEGGYVLELRAAVPDLTAFEERLGWLTRVDSRTWLEAMPAKVVKAADHDAAVREMLQGIPVPDTFAPSRVPDEGLTTTRYQVGAAVTGIVSCLWFRQWGDARRTGDRAKRLEAERAMATSKSWPILREMAKDGAYPATIWRLAREMPSGVWVRGPRITWRLLPKAEGLGCARWGLPVLPWKMRRQR